MINNDRIVPITAISLLDIYAAVGKQVAKLQNIDLVKLSAKDGIGDFELAESAVVFCDEPVHKLELDSTITAGAFFVPAFDFDGIYLDGTKQAVEVEPDGRSLYQCSLAEGTLTVENQMLA